MKYRNNNSITGRTISLESKRQIEYVPGWPSPAYSVALLFYRPERRLSVSLGLPGWSRNIRLWGPRKLFDVTE